MAKLHIWGELDGLPSIDAECIAALAHLIHFDDLDEYTISSSYDASISPNGEFPILEANDISYAGYGPITAYLDSKRVNPEGLQADIEAWSGFIKHRGQALLDLYLYVSSTNYWGATSPAFTKILPWHSNYIIPPARRAAAIARTKHLGIRSLDLDSIDEYAAGDDIRLAGQPTTASSFTGPTNPEQLMKKQQSAKWLRTQQHSDTFQLYQLTKSFFDPLQELLGDKKYLLSNDELTTLDCVAMAYMSLMRNASVPQPWLADALRTRYPKLFAYTNRIFKETFENPKKSWRSRIATRDSPTATQAASAIAQNALHWAWPPSRKTITPDATIENSASQENFSPSQSILSTLLAPSVLLPLGALAGIAFGLAKYIAVSNPPRKENVFYAQEHDFLTPAKLTDLGESGAMLSALGQRLDLNTQYERERERTGGATLVEVDVENEKGEVGRDIVYNK